MALTKKRKLLIVACARSGTTFMQKAFQKCGFDFGHEYVGADGCVSHWFPVEANSYPAFHKLKAHVGEHETRSDYTFQHVLHQVRHPLGVISSNVHTMTKDHRMWLRDFGLVIPERAPKEFFAMNYWLHWNVICEEHARQHGGRTYRIEDIDEEWPSIIKLLDSDAPLPELDRQMHRKARWAKPFIDREAVKAAPDLTWGDLDRVDSLLASAIRAKAKEYGYE